MPYKPIFANYNRPFLSFIPTLRPKIINKIDSRYLLFHCVAWSVTSGISVIKLGRPCIIVAWKFLEGAQFNIIYLFLHM
jgi:hypothetical protein